MATSQAPLKVSQVGNTPVNVKDVENISDVSAAEKAEQSAFNNKNTSKSNPDALTPPEVKPDHANRKNNSIFGDIMCIDLPALKFRIPGLKWAMSKQLNLNFSSDICDMSKNADPVSFALLAAQTIQNNPGLLSPNSGDRLKALLRSDILGKLNILGMGNTIPTCIFGQSVGGMYGDTGYRGPNLKSRNKLKKLLSQNECAFKFSNLPLVSDFISNNAGGAILSTLLDANPDNAYAFLDAALQLTGQRESVLGSLGCAIANAYDYNTRKKLDAIERVNKQTTLTPRDRLALSASSSMVLKNLDNEKKNNTAITTADSKKQLDKITTGLTTIDPTWNKDINGGTTYYQVVENESIKELAVAQIKTNTVAVDSIQLTANYTTTLTPIHEMVILNQFASTQN